LSLPRAGGFLELEWLIHGTPVNIEEIDDGALFDKVVVPGNCLGKTIVVSASMLDKFAKTDDVFLKIASEEKAAEAICMLGSAGDPVGFCSMLLRLGVDPSSLELKVQHVSFEQESVFCLLKESRFGKVQRDRKELVMELLREACTSMGFVWIESEETEWQSFVFGTAAGSFKNAA